MITALILALALAAPPAPSAPAPALPLGELPRQALAKNSCAMFLWDRASGRRVAMVTAQPAQMLVMADGRALSLPALAGSGGESGAGDTVMGFAGRRSYRSAAMTIAIDVGIVPATGGGAVIRDGVLTLTGADGAAVVAPVAGIIGCQ